MSDIGDVNDDGFADVMVGGTDVGSPGNLTGRAFAFYGSATGLATAANWQADGDLPSRKFGHAVTGIGDVNGDDIDDVAISAPSYGLSGEGAVFVWYGKKTTGLNDGVDGTVANAAWRADGVALNERLGHSLAASDVNGDGINDLIVGAPGFSNDAATRDEGAVYIWYGSTSGLGGGVNGDPSNADWMAEGDFLSGKLGITVAAAGDMNDDDIGDFAIAAVQAPGYQAFSGFVWVFHGTPSGPGPGLGAGIAIGAGDSNDFYGYALAAGDFDFDGFDELAIGIPGLTETFNGQGAVVVMNDNSSIPLWFRRGETHGENFGKSLAVGDHDADQLDDLLVGSPIWTDFVTPVSVAGQANLFTGDAMRLLDQDPAWTWSGGESQGQVGYAVAMADVNNDGGADRLVSTPKDDGSFPDQGVAWMWFGVPGPMIIQDDCISPTADLIIEAPVTGRYRGHFGRFVANAGDVNGDGVDDVIAGGPNYGTEGVVFVFHGGFIDEEAEYTGLDPRPAFTFSNPSLSRLGTSVAAAGDVNGDGFDDVIVGATGWGTNYQYIPGGAWLFYGGPNGLDANDPTRRWTATSPLDPDQFGFSVAGVGDIDNDGFDDIMVGAIGYEKVFSNDPHQDMLPRVYLWYGGPNGPANGNAGIPGNADWFAESDQLMDGLGRAIAAAGDIDNNGFDDVVLGAPLRDFGAREFDRGIIWVYRGSAVRRTRTAPGQLGFPGDADDSYIGTEDYENLGWSLSSADVNIDGLSDLIIGSPGSSPGGFSRAGKVTLLWGSPGPLQAHTEVAGDRSLAFFGFSVAGIRDANGDAIDDFMVGAWRLRNDRLNQGRVYLYLGDPGSLPLSPQWHSSGTTDGELLGASVAGADVNADGIADLLAGSPYYELPPNNETGLLSVWHGGAETTLAITPQRVHAGDTVTFRHSGGRPFAPMLLAVVDINGTPGLNWIALETLDETGCWSLSLPVPVGLAGLDLTFQTFTLDVRRNIVASNPVLVQAR